MCGFGDVAKLAANLLGVVNRLPLSVVVAGFEDAACDVADKVGVGADAFNLEKAALASDQAVDGELVDTGALQKDRNRLASPSFHF